MIEEKSLPKAGHEKSEIKEAILRAIVFFDIFSYPLTTYELWRFLGIPSSLEEVDEALSDLADPRIAKQGAFHFLSGRDEIIKCRNRRYNYSNRKMKRAMRISSLFRFIPWIKMIAIGNVMGSNNLKDGSDIDFFIVCEKDRVWITRFFTTLVTKLLFLRPRVNDVRDKICLSFYLGENKLDLEALRIKKGNDPYLVFWLANLIPIYDRDDIYAKIISQNPWMADSLPNWQALAVSDLRNITGKTSLFYRDLIDLFVGGLEKPLRRLQTKILPNDLRLAMNKDTRVVIDEQILKMHVKDRRQAYLELYEEKLEELKKIV